MTRTRLAAFAALLVFAAACDGQIGDAVSSASVSRSVSLPTRTDEAATPGEEPSEEPTEAPTDVPPASDVPSSETGATPGGAASSGSSTTLWWLLGIAIIVAVAVWLIMRRRRPSATLKDAYAATAAARDRLALEASAPSTTVVETQASLDQADRKLRAAQVAGGDQAARIAVDQAIAALGDAREALALRAASSGAAHASGTDIESRLLRSLAALDAALGALLTAAGGGTGSATSFDA